MGYRRVRQEVDFKCVFAVCLTTQAVPKRQQDSIPPTNPEKQNMTSLALTYIIVSPSYGPLQNKTSTCNTVEVPKFHPRNVCAPETPGLFNTGDAKLGFSMGVICRRSSGQKERKTHFGRKTHGDLAIISYSKRECGTLMSGILFFPHI